MIMKKTILIVNLILLATFGVFADVKPAKVDELFEFTSIVWRIAGAEEYSQCKVSSYAADIDRYFVQYRKHPLVDYCKKIRRKRAIGYNAIAGSSSYLRLHGGKIVYVDGYNADSVVKNDARWTVTFMNRYVDLLNEFYSETEFHNFYTEHQSLYQQVEHKMDSLIADNIHPQWFENFFGKPFAEMSIFISVNNGPSNYALTFDSPECHRGILMGGVYEHNGQLRCFESVMTTVIHEIMHSFANPAIQPYTSQMVKASEKLFGSREKDFQSGAYSVQAIPYEWMTRLATLCYLRDELGYKSRLKRVMLLDDVFKGFVLMERSLKFTKNFYTNRQTYKTIDDFMPQLVAFFNYTIIDDYENVLFELKKDVPYVTEVFPAPGTNLDLTLDTIKIEVRFSHDMNMKAEGIRMFVSSGLRDEDYTENDCKSYWLDTRTYVVSVTSSFVKAAKFRGFRLNSNFMQALTGLGMQQDFEVKYKL